MTRIIGLFTAVAAFLGFRSEAKSEQTDQRIIDAFNKSHESWVARGWVEKPKQS
jgi:hypothetical protein